MRSSAARCGACELLGVCAIWRRPGSHRGTAIGPHDTAGGAGGNAAGGQSDARIRVRVHYRQHAPAVSRRSIDLDRDCSAGSHKYGDADIWLGYLRRESIGKPQLEGDVLRRLAQIPHQDVEATGA